jgi:sugar phosphate isomerase/epimerase
MEFIGKTLNGLINKVVLHIEPGSFMTIFSEKHYVYKYDKEYVSRTLKNIKLLEKTLKDYNIRIVLENVPIFPYMENLYKTLNENGVAFTWDVGHDVMYEHYLFSSFRKKFNLNIKHMHLHNVFNRSDHHRLTLGKLNIKEYIKYAMNNDISVVIEVKDRENLEESVNYLYDYLDGIQDQVVEDNIWTP